MTGCIFRWMTYRALQAHDRFRGRVKVGLLSGVFKEVEVNMSRGATYFLMQDERRRINRLILVVRVVLNPVDYC